MSLPVLAMQIPALRGCVMALVVDKKTKAVLMARVGKPGGALTEIEVAEGPSYAQSAFVKPLRRESIQACGQEVVAEVYQTGDEGEQTTWIAVEGPLAGVELRSQSPAGACELLERPAARRHQLEDVDAKGQPVSIPVSLVRYSDGQSYYVTRNQVARALGVARLIKVVDPLVELEIVSLRRDAQRSLRWGR